MSFIFKNRNTSLTARQAAPVMPSLSALPSPAKKVKMAWTAVLLALVIGIMGLASAGCGNQPSTSSVQVSPQSQVAQANPTPSTANSSNAPVPDLLHLASASASSAASMPTGVLTFCGSDGNGHTDLLDYNVATQKPTDHGRGDDGYRAKNGMTLVRVDHSDPEYADLILISADGKTRTTITDHFGKHSTDFILSPDGKTVIYGMTISEHDPSSDGLVSSNVLAIHDVLTHEDRMFRSGTPGNNIMGYPYPEDWMQDGSLLISPSDEVQGKLPSGKPCFINFTFIARDFSGLINSSTVIPPGSTPVKQIFDPRINPSGKRIAFTWDYHIWVANYDGHMLASGAKQVTDSDKNEMWPAWSPDGKWLAVGHKTSGTAGGFINEWTEIYLVLVDGKKHSMNDPISDPAVIELSEKGKTSGMICEGRITWLPSR